MDSIAVSGTVPVHAYASLHDVIMHYYPRMITERVSAKFVKHEVVPGFVIGVEQICLHSCKSTALIGLLRCLGETMDVRVELNSYKATAYVGGVRDSLAAGSATGVAASLAPFHRHDRTDKAVFAIDEIVAEDLEPFQFFFVVFETRGLGIFGRALRAVLQCLDEAATGPLELQFMMTAGNAFDVRHYPGLVEELLDDDVVIVQGDGVCVDRTSFYNESTHIQFSNKTAALQAFRLWRLAYCPCSFLPLDGVGSYVEIGCGNKEIYAARDRYWKAKIDLERAEHDERAHAKTRALQLWERSQEAVANAQYWRAQTHRRGYPALFYAQAEQFALDSDLEAVRLAERAARVPEPRDLAPLRLALEQTTEAGEAALADWINMLPQTEAIDSRMDPVALAEAQADVLAFASVLDLMPEPIGLCFNDISMESGGLFNRYLCELLKDEPVSITKQVVEEPESDEDGIYLDDELLVDEPICLVPTRDVSWTGVAPFLHCIKAVAENREGAAASQDLLTKRVCSTASSASVGEDLRRLLLDRRLLRVNGNLISSFMAGAVVSFLSRTGN
jgi:hypothetical protein